MRRLCWNRRRRLVVPVTPGGEGQVGRIARLIKNIRGIHAESGSWSILLMVELLKNKGFFCEIADDYFVMKLWRYDRHFVADTFKCNSNMRNWVTATCLHNISIYVQTDTTRFLINVERQ
jgi:hypothetical protein